MPPCLSYAHQPDLQEPISDSLSGGCHWAAGTLVVDTVLCPSQHSVLSDLKFLYKVRACVLSRFSRVQLFATLWAVAHQSPLSMGILQVWILEWVAMPFSRGSSWPKDWSPISRVSCTGRQVLYHERHLGSLVVPPQSGRREAVSCGFVFAWLLSMLVKCVGQDIRYLFKEQGWT